MTWCENTLSLPSTSVITLYQLSYETRLSDFSDAILALLLSLMSHLEKKKRLIVQRKETEHFNTRKCLETMDSGEPDGWLSPGRKHDWTLPQWLAEESGGTRRQPVKTFGVNKNVEFLSRSPPPTLLSVIHGETRPLLVRHSDAVSAATA